MNWIKKICNILKSAKIYNKKYSSQNLYFATNSVSELKRDFAKKINIATKRPIRANLTPKNKSILISKMLGENKIYYNIEDAKFIYSTGFFNLKTDYADHYIGFFLSNFWKKQKENFSNGTTQIAINKSSFSKIKMPITKGSEIIDFYSNLLKIETKIKDILNNLNDLLIK